MLILGISYYFFVIQCIYIIYLLIFICHVDRLFCVIILLSIYVQIVIYIIFFGILFIRSCCLSYYAGLAYYGNDGYICLYIISILFDYL